MGSTAYRMYVCTGLEEFKGNLTNKIRKGGKQVDIDT
jgi:hypothetical protein